MSFSAGYKNVGGRGYMYRTRICSNCDNNKFLVIPDGVSFRVECSECHNIKEVFELDGRMVVPLCSKCGGNLFKFREKVKENSIEIDFICSHCGEGASYIYIDNEGKEVTLEVRTLLDMKKFLQGINDRLYNIEFAINGIKSLEEEMIISEDASEALKNINNELNSIKNEAETIDTRIKKLGV